MSAAAASNATHESTLTSRPRLLVIHSEADEHTDVLGQHPAPIDHGDGIQQELPLHWPLDRSGEAATAVLASYPPLPLLPGVPRPDPFVSHAARLVADVIVGARPASQLTKYAVLDVQQELARRVALRRADRTWAPAPARVTSTSTMVVGDAVVQVAVVFLTGQRVHAAALRMEYRHRRWLVVDVQTPA